MPGLGISFLARRARSSWLLLACVAVTVLLATGLAAAGWTFAAAVIPPGAQSVLAAPQGRVIGPSGVVDDAGQAATDSRQIRTALRKAWPGIGFQMEGALWANPIPLSPPPTVRAEPSPVQGLPPPVDWQIQVAALAGLRAQAMLTAGTWPGPPQAGGPLPVALPVAVASRLHVAPGSVLKAATGSGPASAGLRVTGNMTLAEDQVAEAFARAWASWHKVSHHPAPRAWVVRTALNAGVSWWHRRSKETALTSHDIAAADSQAADLDTAVLTALRRLPARQREVIVLRLFLDLDIDTTARQLGIAPGTVRAHLSRAMTALRGELVPATTTEIGQ